MNLLDMGATLQRLQVNRYFYNEVLKTQENSLSKLFNLGNEFENMIDKELDNRIRTGCLDGRSSPKLYHCI